MTDIPKFNFKSTATEADIQKTEEDSKKNEPSMFKPGTYDLKVLSAEYHKPLAGDPTWHGYQLKLGSDTRSIRLYVSVPTSGPEYKKPGMDPKHKMILFHKFREVLRGLGEDPSVDALNKTINKLFSKPTALVGKVLKVDVGYKGPHAQYIEKGVYKLVDRDGKEMIPQTFSDRDSVVAHAAMLGKQVDLFVEILKIHKNDSQTTEVKQTDPWGE